MMMSRRSELVFRSVVAVGALGFAAAQAQTQAPSSQTQTPSSRPQTPPSQAPSAVITDKPGVVYADRKTTTGTVESIDAANRTVTIKRSDGQTVTLKAPPEAKNFDQIKPGDSVRAEYLDAIAIFVRTPSGPPQAGENTTVAVAPKGEKPRAVATKTVEMTAKVEAIDYDKCTVTLMGPQGNRRMVKVDESVKRLNEVKPGDEVVVRYTEAVAIAFSK
jgi:hypothetical protein